MPNTPIKIDATGSIEPIEYRILDVSRNVVYDWQSSPIFPALEDGDYIAQVRDLYGCEDETEFHVPIIDLSNGMVIFNSGDSSGDGGFNVLDEGTLIFSRDNPFGNGPFGNCFFGELLEDGRPYTVVLSPASTDEEGYVQLDYDNDEWTEIWDVPVGHNSPHGTDKDDEGRVVNTRTNGMRLITLAGNVEWQNEFADIGSDRHFSNPQLGLGSVFIFCRDRDPDPDTFKYYKLGINSGDVLDTFDITDEVDDNDRRNDWLMLIADKLFHLMHYEQIIKVRDPQDLTQISQNESLPFEVYSFVFDQSGNIYLCGADSNIAVMDQDLNVVDEQDFPSEIGEDIYGITVSTDSLDRVHVQTAAGVVHEIRKSDWAYISSYDSGSDIDSYGNRINSHPGWDVMRNLQLS